MPRVLNRDAIPALTQGLDASDILECYALVRSAPLHGIANSTIHIQKTAIGFRYRPPGSQLKKMHTDKQPVEMTLEYGPQRVGPLLRHEAMPYIQGMDQDYSFIGWENEGRVFYTTEIVTETYVSSYYMASMSGAVLNKILVQAVEYSELRRRYLPFSIFSAKKGREVRSSSSVDFAQYIWRQLANLGVEIHPILPPPIYEARLWVDSWETVIPSQVTSNEAASFYKKLYQCLEAIATNDYSAYAPPVLPTGSPVAVSRMPSLAPSIASTKRSPSRTPRPTEKATNPIDEASDVPGNRTLDDREVEESDGTDGSINDLDDDDAVNIGDPVVEKDPNTESQSPSTAKPAVSPSPVSPAPTSTVIVPEDKVEEAKQAVATAQQAADEAKSAAQTDGDTKAADAAQSAATAAQVAVDATSDAAAKAAMDGLLSGDGATMTSIVTQCLTREKYGIASINGNGTTTIDAFLYLEGTNYYKLKMTSPFLEIAKINRALPVAVKRSELMGGGEPVDFVLAFLVLSSVFLLVIFLLQQVGYECCQSLFRCQRWFFNPRKYDYEGNTLDKVGDSLHVDEDNIPLSMGGRASKSPSLFPRTSTPKSSRTSPGLDSPELNSPNSAVTRDSLGELEMSILSSGRSAAMSSDRNLQRNLSGDDIDENLAVVPERLFRDPDLVDMPHLKSTSRVAIPVGSNQQAPTETGHPNEVEYTFDAFS